MSLVWSLTVQGQMDSLSTFVRQRLRSSAQQAAITSDTPAPRAAAALDDRAEQLGPAAGVDASVSDDDAGGPPVRPGNVRTSTGKLCR